MIRCLKTKLRRLSFSASGCSKDFSVMVSMKFAFTSFSLPVYTFFCFFVLPFSEEPEREELLFFSPFDLDLPFANFYMGEESPRRPFVALIVFLFFCFYFDVCEFDFFFNIF
jgi:hypothetical protein